MAIRHMVRTLAGLVFLVAAGVAQTAHAQNWDGAGQLRFGTFLQGSFLDGGVRETTTAASVIQQSVSPSAFGIGLSFGYDLRLGSIVLGAEIDGSFDHGDDKVEATGAEFAVDYHVTARGRLGVMATSDILLYATAGLGVLGSEYKLAGFTGGGGTTANSFKKNAVVQGVTFGGGVEYDAQWAIWFAEYLHTDYGSWTFTSFNGNQVKYDPSSDVVRAGLKFRIGHDHGHGGYARGPAGHEPLK